jgi:hypothetical protein
MFNVATDPITAKPCIQNKSVFNEFVANVLHDNIGSKEKSTCNLRKKNEAVF